MPSDGPLNPTIPTHSSARERLKITSLLRFSQTWSKICATIPGYDDDVAALYPPRCRKHAAWHDRDPTLQGPPGREDCRIVLIVSRELPYHNCSCDLRNNRCDERPLASGCGAYCAGCLAGRASIRNSRRRLMHLATRWLMRMVLGLWW